ncbi:MAG: divalent-cation tolerance protein CutA [Alphaproteobacteria bacterium]|nr:divalent-cation tolerance protein CutA [Alphaproteobacteria bacterium]MDD9920234.1 divalent-cation tolerance protein CutA [Alphaproteobacteria bacterium]
MPSIVMIYTTFSNRHDAETLGEDLVNRGYAACVNITPTHTSIYRWEGQVQRQEEVAMIVKTSRNRVDEVMLEVHRLHPYDVPAITIWEAQAHPSFVSFVDEHTKEF